MTDQSTRDKILKISHKLFSEKGFTGVSVREIAKLSQCNIAAINYHFQNKENLYVETVKESIARTESDIKTIYDSLGDRDIDLFTTKVLEHFKEHNEDLRTGFKMLLTQYNSDSLQFDFSKYRGPPGGEYFDLCLKHHFPHAKNEDVEWAVRTLFTQVIHKSLLLCNKGLCSNLLENEDIETVFYNDIRRLLQLIKTELSQKTD